MTSSAVQGTTAPHFAPLRAAFETCFAEGWEHGASVAVVHRGVLVAELWGGHADAAKTKPWQQDSLTNIWSTTKGIAALAVAMLVERGLLSYDDPVAKVWPEFAAKGKGAITLGQALSHQAGLEGLVVPMDTAGLYAWFPYADALAAMAPLWPPGSRSVYHALSLGVLAGEPVRRVTGQTIGQFIAAEIAGPLGADLFVGLPEAQDHRATELIEGPKASDWVANVQAGGYPHSCQNPAPEALAPNTRAWRAAEIPGANGFATARALAEIYGDLVSGASKLISAQGLAEATKLRFKGTDASFDSPTAYAAGFSLFNDAYGPRASAGSFGHTGWGGSFAFADPAQGLGFAYVTNRMLGFDDGIDPRRKALVDAVYQVLDAAK